MGAVDRQYAKLIRPRFVLALVAHIHAGERRNAVPWLPQRIVEVYATRLIEWKRAHSPEVDPKDRALSQAKKVSNHRDAENDGRYRAKNR